MANLENYQLVHPELLTEDALLQVLRDRCIVAPILGSSSRSELVEIFKRVALPLPQRNYNDSTYLGRKLIGIRRNEVRQKAGSLDTAYAPFDIKSACKSNGSGHQGQCITDRLKPPLMSLETESNEIRFSKISTLSNTLCTVNKRTSKVALPEPSSSKKRQKITWP